MVDDVGEQDRGSEATGVDESAPPIKAIFQAPCIVPSGTECVVHMSGPSEYRDEREFYFACHGKKAKILAHSEYGCTIQMLEGEWNERMVQSVRSNILCLSGHFIPDSAGE